MKKKMLSEEALKVLLKPVETTAEGVPPVVDIPATPEAAETPNEETPYPTVALTAEIEKLKAEAAGMTDKLAAELTAEKDQHVAEIAAANAAITGLKGIVVDQISKMRIGLNFAAVDMADFSAEALVTEFNSISEKFMKALPVGSVIPERQEKKEEKMTSLDLAAINSLGF